jgi:TonB-linked SusC/RagA family outer membrane protein
LVTSVAAHRVSAQEQRVPINGRVLTPDNTPVPGAVITISGTNIGTAADMDGAFSLNVPPGSVLSVQSLGYISQDVSLAAGQSSVTVTLQPDVQEVDEVVVIGYGVQRKSDVTGAISQVKSSDMENRSITRPEQALQGKTAGVQLITTSGAPGDAPSIRIRGIGSNNSSTPLYIVDGLRMGDISGVDPNSIQSMEVLKDAASAAIYGAEAGNGVILITTKKGTAGTSRIDYSFQYTIQSIKKVPRVLNADEYIEYMTEGGFVQQTGIDTYWDGNTDTNWLDIAFEPSLMRRHTLSFQGGNDRGSYYLSLAYLDNDGIVTGDRDTYRRLTARINADYKIKPWFTVGTTTSVEKFAQNTVSFTSEAGGVLTSALQMDPLTPYSYGPNNLPSYMKDLLSAGQTLLQDESGDYYSVSQFYSSEAYHPMITRDRTKDGSNNFSVNGTIYGNFTPVKNLVITSRLGYDLRASSANGFNRPYYGSGVANSVNYSAWANLSNSINYEWENFANYSLKVNRHTFDAMAGMSFSDRYIMTLRGTVDKINNPSDPNFWYISAQTSDAVKALAGVNNNPAGTPMTTRNLSYFGRLGYNFDNRYMAQVQFRADAADLSKLSPTQRWGYFPSVSLGWDVSNESFFPKQNTVNQVKLRASWGQNGSTAGLGNYNWMTSIDAGGSNYIFSPDLPQYSYGSGPTGLGNEQLRWETHEQIDFGLDARFFNNRLNFTMDWFQKKTNNLIINGATLSMTSGFNTAPPLNAGSIENSGFELELGWRDSVGELEYSVNANLATLNNKVTEIHRSLTRINGAGYQRYPGLTVFEVGYPAWYFRGYEFLGIDDATGEPTFNTSGEPGGIPTDVDKTMIGNPMPDFTYGITINLAWKGIDFTMFGTGSQGNDMWMLITRPDRTTGNRLHYLYEDRWTATNTSGTKPKAAYNRVEQYLTSNAWVFDGSFFKIKQIQLGYTLPEQWTKRLHVDGLRAYVSLEDFITFTSYPGFDPEVSYAGNNNRVGLDMGNYPISKKVVFGVNFTF